MKALLISICLTAGLCPTSLAVDVANIHLLNWSTPELDGPADRLAHKLQQHLNFNYQSFPPARGLYMFANKLTDCVLVGDENTIAQYTGLPSVNSAAISDTGDYFVTAQNQPTIDNIDMLTAKHIAMQQGTDAKTEFGEEVFSKITVEYANSHQSLIQMLLNDRVDVIVLFSKSALQTIDLNYQGQLHYNENFVINFQYRKLNCHDTPANRAFIAQFNEQINQLKLSGDFEQIMDRVVQHEAQP